MRAYRGLRGCDSGWLGHLPWIGGAALATVFAGGDAQSPGLWAAGHQSPAWKRPPPARSLEFKCPVWSQGGAHSRPDQKLPDTT